MSDDKAERRRWARFKEQVKPLLGRKWRELYDPDGNLREAGSRFRGPCPIHGGDGSSFTVDPDKLTWSCHSGCGSESGQAAAGGGPVEFLERRDKLTEEQARDRLAELVGVDLDREPGGLTLGDVERALSAEATKRHLDPALLRSAWGFQPTIRRGLIDDSWRDRPAVDFPTPAGPTPRIRYLDGHKPKCGWPSLKEREKHGWPAVKAALYGLSEALPLLPQGGPLYVVNGEPSVWAAYQAKVPAICFCMGEGSTPPAELVKRLAGTLRERAGTVRVVYDLDDPGRKGAANVVKALRKAGLDAGALELPADLGPGGDVDDLHRRTGDENLAAALAALPELLVDQVEQLPEGDQVASGTAGGAASAYRVAPTLECSAALTSGQLTELGNAERLISYAGDLLLHNEASGWRVWNGQRWAVDTAGQVKRWAQEAIRLMLRQAGEAFAAGKLGSEGYEALVKHGLRSEKASALAAMAALASTHRQRQEDQFDVDPWLFNVCNGTLDLRTGTLRPHDRADFLTRQAPVAFDPAATCPRWDTFLAEILPDPDACAFVQRAIGYSLTGETSEQVLFLLHGAGSNGKGVLLDTIAALLGDKDGYAAAADFSTFLATNDEKGAAARPDLVFLVGSRFVSAVEPSDGARWSDGLLKKLTGQDPVTTRQLHKAAFTFYPAFKLWFGCNNLPRSRDSSEGFWRRIRLIPFRAVFAGKARDPELREKLKAELSGILNWALAGLRAWRTDGLGSCPEVDQEVSEYRDSNDALGKWLKECCLLRFGAQASADELRRSLEAWCQEEGIGAPPSPKALAGRLRAAGCTRFKSHGSRLWNGIGLLADDGYQDARNESGALGAHGAGNLPTFSKTLLREEVTNYSAPSGASAPEQAPLPLPPLGAESPSDPLPEPFPTENEPFADPLTDGLEPAPPIPLPPGRSLYAPREEVTA